MRKLERYIARYGPETGPKLFHLLQSQAGHASVSARLRKKLAALRQGHGQGATPRPTPPPTAAASPLFPEPVPAAAPGELGSSGDCQTPPHLGGCDIIV
jgi:hypothetical protein